LEEKDFMRLTIKILILTAVLVLAVNGQISMKEALSPTEADLSEAQMQGVEVFKLLPRGMFGENQNELKLRGGGAFYSFVKKSYSYNEIPQIKLEQDMLSVGFYGANYGLIADLGETPLGAVSRESRETGFLISYQPVKYKSASEPEYRKIGAGFEYSGLKYKTYLPVAAGHTYLLRAISYEEADALVAFQVRRKEADGSLVIFWKFIEQFEKPVLLHQTDEELTAKLQKIYQNEIFKDVKFEVKDNFVILSGKVPRGTLNDLLKYVTAERTRGMQIRVTQ
jgi:hypothetical protein